MGPLDAKVVEQDQDVVGHLGDRIADRRMGRLAGAAVVERDHAMRFLERLELRVPEHAHAAEAGDEQQRLAPVLLTAFFVVQPSSAMRRIRQWAPGHARSFFRNGIVAQVHAARDLH